MGAGPRILVLIGRTARLPTWRTSGSSLSAEWYAYCSLVVSYSQTFGFVTHWHDDGRVLCILH